MVTETREERSPRSPSEPAITLVACRAGTRVPDADLASVGQLLEDPEVMVWIDLVRPDAETAQAVRSALGLHPLVVEDILEQNQRSKIEFIGDDIHIVLFALAYEGALETWEIDFVLGERFLLSVHTGWDPKATHHLRLGIEPILGRGPDFLLYSLADAIVDGYFPVIDRVGDEVDRLQDDVLTDASAWSLQKVFEVKRELIELRRVTAPAREVFNQLTDRELPHIRPDHIVYFRDVYDHLLRVTDELDIYRELLAGTLELYLTMVNNNLSVVMKRLTGVTVILAGIGAVAGVFGMSEAGAAFSGLEAFGFWGVTGAIVLAATATVVFLRRIDWI
jgi:magnesium transporter